MEKFSFEDIIRIHELIYTLRQSTQPVNEHSDPLSVDDVWNDLEDLVDKFSRDYKDHILTKSDVEKLIGKEVHHYRKVYDSLGRLKRIDVQPVSVLELIECEFTIRPTNNGTD